MPLTAPPTGVVPPPARTTPDDRGTGGTASPARLAGHTVVAGLPSLDTDDGRADRMNRADRTGTGRSTGGRRQPPADPVTPVTERLRGPGLPTAR